MKEIPVLVVGLATLGTVALPVWAQGQPGRRAAKNYDPHTVETISGEVVRVEHVAAAGGKSGGVHLTLKSDGETLPIHLGPAWYVDQQPVQVRQGDHIEVEGSRVSISGKPVIIARRVTKGGEILTLRNEAGVPAWAGRGGGRPTPQ